MAKSKHVAKKVVTAKDVAKKVDEEILADLGETTVTAMSEEPKPAGKPKPASAYTSSAEEACRRVATLRASIADSSVQTPTYADIVTELRLIEGLLAG